MLVPDGILELSSQRLMRCERSTLRLEDDIRCRKTGFIKKLVYLMAELVKSVVDSVCLTVKLPGTGSIPSCVGLLVIRGWSFAEFAEQNDWQVLSAVRVAPAIPRKWQMLNSPEELENLENELQHANSTEGM